MKGLYARRLAFVVVVAACALGLTLGAFADTPATIAPSVDGLEHAWVVRRMAYAPYTELTRIERAAIATANRALVAPPLGVIREADKGYAEAQADLLLAKSLRKQDPEIVGHEVVVFNDTVAARCFVSESGVVRVLETGPVQRMLVTRASAANDRGDEDAIELAKQAFAAASEIDPKVAPATGGLVSAHAIGFADRDGSHIVVRSGLDGSATYPDW